MKDNHDRYENLAYITNLDRKEYIYTIIETDKKKGTRISVINSKTSKLIKEIRLDDSLSISFMDTLDNIMREAA